MPEDGETFNLFIYGTLKDPRVFRAVLGRRLVRRRQEADQVASFCPQEAILDGYTKISPDHTYLYAVPDPQGRIRGLLVGPLPKDCLDALGHYEGRNYSRRRVDVQTRDGTKRAVAFVGKLRQLEHSFGYAFRDPLKQEVLLQRKIDAALRERERRELHTHEHAGRRAVSELHGPTIRDLVRRHFDAGGISDYAIRHSIQDRPLPDFASILDDPEAVTLAPNYLGMMVRQAIFNEFEERIHQEFRYELDHMPHDVRYYDRTISSLVALGMLNDSPEVLGVLIGDCLTEMDFHRDRLVDFVRWAIDAADALYEPARAKQQLTFVRSHMGQGFIPLGAELEFSNIGHDVIHDPDGRRLRDRTYDGFYYFADFGLDVLTWRLGGHIDDHRLKAPGHRRRGFFEVALGSLSIEANLSKPVTSDPWVLNQFIHQAMRFYEIAPHSVHISLELRRQQRPDVERMLPLAAMKCLFAVAGDPVRRPDGRVRINRLVTDEIIRTDRGAGMLFSEIRKRHSSEVDESFPSIPGRRRGRYVQQFRFPRLAPRLNYEPIAMALKGLQISRRPGSFLTPTQYEQSPAHRRRFEQLIEWGANPQPISEKDIEKVLGYIHEGLMTERRSKPAHSEAYIAWAISEIRTMLTDFNRMLTEQPTADKSNAPAAPGFG